MLAVKDHTKTNARLHQIDQQYYLPTFKRHPIAIDRAKGCRVWDVEGKEYLDVLAGIAVNNLGHCHPKVIKAMQRQLDRVIHISNFYVSTPQVLLAKKLAELSGLDRVFFTNSGAESVEGAIKIARKYASTHGRGGGIISMHGSFHGRTLATIATGKERMQRGFGPMPEGFFRVPFNDPEALEAEVGDHIAAVILEPVQGEGGIRPAEPCYLRYVRELCNRHNIVLIFDEVQTGIGRTGQLFAKDHFEVQPDVMALAKGLGNGMPIGAVLSTERVSSAIEFGDHGTTFGGNPLACVAGLATLETIEEENLLIAAIEKGALLRKYLQDTLGKQPELKEVRGLGLMIGVEFTFETQPLVMELLHRGVLANATAGNVLRLVPPLVISLDEIKELVDRIVEAFEAVKPR